MLGHQLYIDLFECEPSLLDDPLSIELTVQTLAKKLEANILQIHSVRFMPQGISCLAQISASHISIHTWPENSFAAIDIFSCKSKINIDDIIEFVQERFRASSTIYTEAFRGQEIFSPFFG